MPRNTIRINVNIKTKIQNNKQLNFSEIDLYKKSNKGIQADEQPIFKTSSFGIIDKIFTLLRAHQYASLKVATLLFKPNAYQGKNPPNYVGFSIPNAFVVGYGLDYNEKGRNLDSIYQLKAETK